MPVKENKIGAIALSKLSDAALAALQQDVNDEIIRREATRQRRRQEWIEHMSWEAYHRGAVEVVGDTVIVAVLKNGSIHMAKTHPINGDVFDMDTGVAVAYYKAMGLRVPDFI